METLQLDTSSAALHAGIDPLPPILTVAEAEAARAAVGEAAFDGLRWRFRDGFEHILATLPAQVWQEPERQDWQLVKHNAAREVWHAEIRGRSYFLKYYLRPRGAALKHIFRAPASDAEWRGGLYTLAAGIPAVRPVGCCASVNRGGRSAALLITDALEPCYPLADFWLTSQADTDAARRRQVRRQLADGLAEMIARAHQAGFQHMDMHAANILVQPLGRQRYRTAFVDLHCARLAAPVSARAVVSNLAQLNQWFRRHSSVKDRLRFLRAYVRWRNECEHAYPHARPLGLTFDELAQALRHAAERQAHKIWSKRDRRITRNGRYFTRLRLADGWRGAAVLRCKHATPESRASRAEFDRTWWQDQLRNPLGLTERATADSYKQSHSAQVSRTLLAHPDGPLPAIVKLPRARDGWRRLVQWLAPSRSARAWRIGHALLHRDIPAARPLAYLEQRLGPFVRANLLLTEALPGGVALDAYLRGSYADSAPHEWWRCKQRLTGLLVRQLRMLEERGFAHRDCKASNLLVVPHPELRLLWIDFDGIRQRRYLPAAERTRPLTRLHVSLLDSPGVTRADRARLLRAYCARFGSDPRAWRALWHQIAAAAERGASARAARRRWKLEHYGRP